MNEEANVGRVEVADPDVWVKVLAKNPLDTASFPLKIASPVTLIPPVVMLRAATSRPPVNEEVPMVVTSKTPDTLRPSVDRAVETSRLGIVDVADEVWVIFPEVRKSPDKLRDDPFNPVAEIPPTKVEVPVVVTDNSPSTVSPVTSRFVVSIPEKVDVPVDEVIFPAMMASPVETWSPPVEVSPTKVEPPANEEVPVVVTSREPVRVREVAARSVTVSFGMVEVAVDTCVIFPDERRRSPPDTVIPTAEDNPPVVVTLTPPEKVEVPAPLTSRVLVAIKFEVLIES